MDQFDNCISKGRIKEIEPDAERAASELCTALDELSRARDRYQAGNWNETATLSYFAMFRCARAAINSRGYKDTNLFGLCVALESLFVSNQLLPANIVKQIQKAKDIKDAAYSGHKTAAKDAKELLKWALTMAKTVFQILSLPGFGPELIETTLPEKPGSPQNQRKEADRRVRYPKPLEYNDKKRPPKRSNRDSGWDHGKYPH